MKLGHKGWKLNVPKLPTFGTLKVPKLNMPKAPSFNLNFGILNGYNVKFN